MAAIFADEHFRELTRVGEVAVMREHHAVRRVHVERLGFADAIATGGGVADVANADVTAQLQHVVLSEYISHQATALARAKLAFGRGGDAGRILPAVLEHGERIVEALIDRGGSDDSDYSTHARTPSLHLGQ